jgi:hypothetical protein
VPGEFAVAGDEVGMKMSLDYMADLQPLVLGFLKVNVDVPLRIHHGGFPVRADQIGGMREAAETELLEKHLLSPALEQGIQ